MDQKCALSPREVIKTYPELTRSEGVLANWRSQRKGPRFYKLGRRVIYRPSDIEDFLFKNPVLTFDSCERRA